MRVINQPSLNLRQCKVKCWHWTLFLIYIAVAASHPLVVCVTAVTSSPVRAHAHLILESCNLQSLNSDTCWSDLYEWHKGEKWMGKWLLMANTGHCGYLGSSYLNHKCLYHHRSPTCDSWCNWLCCGHLQVLYSAITGSSSDTAVHTFCAHLRGPILLLREEVIIMIMT